MKDKEVKSQQTTHATKSAWTFYYSTHSSSAISRRHRSEIIAFLRKTDFCFKSLKTHKNGQFWKFPIFEFCFIFYFIDFATLKRTVVQVFVARVWIYYNMLLRSRWKTSKCPFFQSSQSVRKTNILKQGVFRCFRSSKLGQEKSISVFPNQ